MAATTTKRKKKADEAGEAAPAPASAPVPIGDTLARIADPARQEVVLLGYIRHREAGLPLSFAEWVDLTLRLWELDRDPEANYSQLLEGYITHYGIEESARIDILAGYLVDLAAGKPDQGFPAYVAGVFAGTAADEAANGQADAAAAEPEPEPVSEPEPEPEPVSEPEPEPEPVQAAKPARRPPGAVRKVVDATLLNKRVVYKAGDGRLVYGICTREGEGTVDLTDDYAEAWTNVKRAAVKLDEGPIVWTVTKAEAEAVARMTKKGRGLWPGAEADAILFERVRRVSPNLLCVVIVYNAEPEPFLDAYVFDEAAPEGDHGIVFSHPAIPTLVGDYLFEVPGLPDIPARVALK